ncbi:MAG: hypothetical protein JZD40_01095 [Sulfolobus sp.]|nr:hypothetical protein [Sulfolobus sp.]
MQNKPMGVSDTINWYSKVISVDMATALMIFIGSFFTMIPVLNIFAIPFTSAITFSGKGDSLKDF